MYFDVLEELTNLYQVCDYSQAL